MPWSDHDDDLSLVSTSSLCDIQEGEEYGTTTEEEEEEEEYTTIAVPTATTDNQMEDDYIPDSLRDFIAEADAALEECMNSDSDCDSESSSLTGGGGSGGGSIGRGSNVDFNVNATNEHAASTSASATIIPTEDGVDNDRAHLTHNNNNNNINSNNDNDNDLSFGTATPNSHSNSMLNTTSAFLSPISDVQGGPFDTDIGSACRVNPVTHYVTESAVKRIALNDDPGVCPDHGDGCICHLKVERRLEDYLLAANSNVDNGICMQVTDGQGQGQGFGSGQKQGPEHRLEMYGSSGRDMVADDSFSSPVLAKQLAFDDNQNVDVDIDGDVDMNMMMDVDEVKMSIPQDNISNGNSHGIDMDDDDDDSNFLPNGTNDDPSATLMTTSPSAFTNTISTSKEEDDAFLPNSDSFDMIPQCDTMKQSNVSAEAAAAAAATATAPAKTKPKPKPKSTNVNSLNKKTVTIKKQKRFVKPGIMASIEKKKATTAAAANPSAKPKRVTKTRVKGTRRVTVPKSPALNTKKLRGERRYSGVGGPASVPSSSTSTNSSGGTGIGTGNENTNRINKNNTRRSSTVPKGPTLVTQNLHGDRQYSAVGFRDEKKEMDHNANGSAGAATIDYKKKALTVPKSPHLISSVKLGDRKYSAVGTREVKDTNQEPVVSVDYKKKALTVPKAPKLISSEKLGDRKYSAVGPRHNHHGSHDGEMMGMTMGVIHENQPTKSQVDYKTKALTVPKGPKLISSEKLGNRRYSGVGAREEKIEEKKEDEAPTKINYKTKALTVPKAPKLISSKKLGDRKYSGVGAREEKMEEVVEIRPKIDYKNKKPTVPKAPTLSTASRPQREKKAVKTTSEKEKQVFKAMPIMSGVLEQKPLGIHKVSKKAPTVPKPFHLKTDERIPDNKLQRTKKKEDKSPQSTVFRARPVPDFSRLQSTMQRNTVPRRTKPQPFHLKTDEIAMSPRRTRISKASKGLKKSIPFAPQQSKKRIVTTPKPFNFTQVVKVSSPSRERVASKSKPFSHGKVKSPKPPTTPKPFKFTPPPKRNPKPTIPKDLAHFMSPTKKRKVTVPKPFRLSANRPAKLPTPPSTKVESKKATKKVFKPPAPPKTKRNPTKLKPFRLSSTNNSKIKSPENREGVTKQNKARPTTAKTSPTMQSTPFENEEENSPAQTSVTSPDDTENTKDDCPIAFRRKLLLRSRSNTNGKGTDRDEQAKLVVNQLEELSALVQQAVI